MILSEKKPLFAAFITSATIAFCAENPKAQQNWGQWRGPLATGYAPHADPPIQWSETKNVLWKTALPGLGHSSPIVWGNHVYLTTAIPIGKELSVPNQPAEAHNNLGVALAIQNKIDEAIIHFQEALRIAPDFVDTQNNLNFSLEKKKNNPP